MTTVIAALLSWGNPALAVAAFAFTKVVDSYTPVPGGGAYFNFNFTAAPTLSGNRVTFDTNGIWVAKIDGTQLTRIISTNTKIPGGDFGTFKQAYGDWGQIRGNTVVLVGDSCGGCGSGVGIYARKLGSPTITRLADINMYLPGSSTVKFGGFLPDFAIGPYDVVFMNGQKVYSVPIGGGAITEVAGDKDKLYTPPQPYCCLFAKPTIKQSLTGSTVLLNAGNVYGRKSIDRVDLSGDTASFRVIAKEGMHAPGTPFKYRFDSFEFTHPVIDQGYVFFGGSTTDTQDPYIWGIYHRGGGSGLVKLVDSNTPVPGGNGNFFGPNLGVDTIAAKAGIVVFSAKDGNSYPGIYAVPESGGEITKIVAYGDVVGGYTVNDVRMWRGGFDGKTLVFYVSYANFQGAGIYTTPVVLP